MSCVSLDVEELIGGGVLFTWGYNGYTISSTNTSNFTLNAAQIRFV